MSTIIIIGGGGGGGGNNGQTATVMQDGSIVDESTGATVAKFDSVADAIAYLQHMNPLSAAQLAEAEDPRA